jgi:hypothetical protein
VFDRDSTQHIDDSRSNQASASLHRNPYGHPCTLLHCLLSHTHNHRLCVKGIALNLYRLHSPAAEALPCYKSHKLASALGAMNAIPSALWCVVAISAPSCCPHYLSHSTSDYMRIKIVYDTQHVLPLQAATKFASLSIHPLLAECPSTIHLETWFIY